DDQPRLQRALERETQFGMGATFRSRRQHEVMDADWRGASPTPALKERAGAQLGASGSRNPLAGIGRPAVLDDAVGLPRGEYVALLSHSGSRGTGAQIAQHYSRLARDLHPELPKELANLAWLDLASEPGREYWSAMELMGRYAAANHALIHAHVARAVGVDVRLDIENHHNFAWRERHRHPDGTEAEVIVHRKGATPAGAGVLGIIPGSMGDARLRGARQRRRRVAEFGGPRRRAAHEPHQGKGDLHLGHGEVVSQRARRHAVVRR